MNESKKPSTPSEPVSLERIRDQLKCSLNMGGLKGSAEWAVGALDRLIAERASLPVGVPDVSVLQRLLDDVRDVRSADDVAFGWYEAVERICAPAAPTIKAEQVDCLYCQGHGDVTRVSGQTAESYSEHNEECPECQGTGLSHSLPAAGSAGEEVEVVAYLFIKPDGKLSMDAVRHKPGQAAEPVMTVAQHERIVAALSAQQSAPDRVSVPVELLREALSGALQGPTLHSMIEAKRQLRALLASHGRGEA